MKWQIDVFEGKDRMKTFDIPQAAIDRAEVGALLQRLCCTHLNYDEIVGCVWNKSGEKWHLIDVQVSEGGRLSCYGGTTQAHARLLDD